MTAEYTGDSNGITPRLATIKANAMVAKGADKALPTTVRRSSVKPNADNNKSAVRQNVGLPMVLVVDVLKLWSVVLVVRDNWLGMRERLGCA